jgi:hypothetical protein
MFSKNTDDRISSWSTLRLNLETSQTPFDDVCEFWRSAPYTPFNRRLDPHYQKSWPTPWEIISENCYDDFTKAVMIAWTLRYTTRFKNEPIELRTYVDKNRTIVYNVVIISNKVLNFSDNGPVDIADVNLDFMLENLIDFNFEL